MLDLASCVPGLRIFRLFRIVRAVRIVRRLGGPRVLGELREGLASGALYFIVFVGLAVLEFVGLLQLRFEEDAPGANITTASDALWWGYVTATTVGYGDQFPVTTGGRLAGLVMLTVGVALFGDVLGVPRERLSLTEEATEGTCDEHEHGSDVRAAGATRGARANHSEAAREACRARERHLTQPTRGWVRG